MGLKYIYRMELSFILNHLGEEREKYFNAVSPPVMQTSNFVFDSVGDLKQKITTEYESNVYTRGNNPTVEILRKKIAALEHAEDCLVFSSGAAAVAAAVSAQVSQGDHIVCVKTAYSWTKTLIQKYLPRFGVTFTIVDGTNMDEIKAAINLKTKVLYLESPTSTTMELQDLGECAAIAKKNNLVTIIDNSYSSPLMQNPIDFGIDMVVHSGTKYINGHSDVVMGVVCGTKEMMRKIFYSEYMTIGHIISPHDAALAIRGLRTIHLRVERSAKSCAYILEKLQTHPKIAKIYYPFLSDQQSLATKQMKGGGMFSLAIRADSKVEVVRFCESLKTFLIAVSWGGHESLIMPVVAFYDNEGFPDSELPWNMVRFYIGLEDPDYLLQDILQALDKV